MDTNNQNEQVRRIVDEVLLGGGADCVHNFFNEVGHRAKCAVGHFDGAVVLEYFWDLARIGAVAVPGGDFGGVSFGGIPRFMLTERGRCLLEQGENSPHSPDRYLAAVRTRVGTPDDVAMSYLCEAVEAWRCGLHRSSTVMLGCACERLVLLLAEAIASNEGLPHADKLASALRRRVFVSSLFEEIRTTLSELRASKRLSRGLGDGLDRRLSAVFDHARGLRNQSGHPTGESVAAEDAEAGLLLFPGFYFMVQKLVAELRELSL
jgi:hypothetical protein